MTVTEQRVVRCLQLLSFLNETVPCSAGGLAQDLGVNERTIRRDMALLKGAGFDIVADIGGYLLADSSKARIAMGEKRLCPAQKERLADRMAQPSGLPPKHGY